MNKNVWLTAMTAALLAVVSLPASGAEAGWYIGVEGGATFQDDAKGTIEVDPNANTTTSTSPVSCAISIPGLLCLLPSPGSTTTAITLGPGDERDYTAEYETGFLGGLTLGYLFQNGFRPELELRYSENDIDTLSIGGTSGSPDGSVTSTALMTNLWFNFNRDGDWHPYIGAGVGVAKLELEFGEFQGEDTVLAYQGGVGISYDLTEHTVIDLGYRYFTTDDPQYETDSTSVYSEFTQQVVMLSLRYTFAPAAPPDYDGDGVPASRDECPNTPKGVPVNAQGCPIDGDADGVPDYKDQCPGTPKGVPVNDKGCPLDSDGDGVPDYKDECPNTAAGVKVNASGCPLVIDSDGDGVPDDMDECPNTPPGVPVMTNGCAKGQSLVLEGVHFKFDSAQLTAEAKQILLETVQVLKDSPGFRVKIAGHTGAIGTAAYNLRLSKRRAQSVATFLINHGIDPSRLETVGYGETRPIATNETEAGRAKNRRVELHVIGNSTTASATTTLQINIPMT